jgi:hypothetical protein
MEMVAIKFCGRCSNPTANGPWRGGRIFCLPCREFLRREFAGYRRYAMLALGLALAVLSGACGGAVEPQPDQASEPACGYVVAEDGGEVIHFNDTDAWTFLVTDAGIAGGGYVLELQGDAEALTIPQADAVGACLSRLLHAGQPSGTTTL